MLIRMVKFTDRERILEYEKSREPYTLRAQAILRTITKELIIHRQNAQVKSDRVLYKKSGAKSTAKERKTAVAPKHLNLAGDHRHVLKGMIKDHINFSDINQPFQRYLVYRDREQLEVALRVAEQHYGKLH